MTTLPGIDKPYGASAELYLSAGWTGVLPLPTRAKKAPPSGFTGANGTYPSEDQIAAWIGDRANGNVALRPPCDVIGIDVDAYDGRVGGETLGRLEVVHGALPKTVISSARADGVSGIRWFRVPPGRKWRDLGQDVQVVWCGHRYAVVWPSVHPQTKTVYEWYDGDWARLGRVPGLDDLAMLPHEWVDYLGAPEWASGQPASRGEGVAQHVSKFAGWSDRDGRRVDVEAILAGGLDGCSSQRDALIRLVASARAYGNPEVIIRELGYRAVANFPQTKPEPWTHTDVDKLVAEWCAKHAPGKSEVTLSPEQALWVDSLRAQIVTQEDEPVRAPDPRPDQVIEEYTREKARRLARRELDREEFEALRVPRTRVTAAEFAQIPPPDVVMREVLAAEVNLLGGRSAQGKSLLARDWALHVASGEAWRGHRVERPRSVLWLASEGLHDFAERWATQPLWERAKRRVFVVPEPVNLLDESDVTSLLGEYARDGVGLVVFDLIYGMGMTDDNGVRDVQPVITALKRISREWRAATLAIGHSGHNGSRRFRGSSAWGQQAAVEWHMADGTLSCEKSKIANVHSLSASYEVDYPGVRWLSSAQGFSGEVDRRNRIAEHIRAHPEMSVNARAQALAGELGLGNRRTRDLIKSVQETM